jgi:hypothetical protein
MDKSVSTNRVSVNTGVCGGLGPRRSVEDGGRRMKLKLDENLSRRLKPILIELGHDVLTTADEDLLSHPDIEVAVLAAQENRILLTLDIEPQGIRIRQPK